MSKLKGNRIKVIVYIVVAVIIVCGGNWLYKSRRVHFEDDMMRQVICLELGKDKDSHDVTYRDLESIEELKIGPVGNFETIEDVAKCKNLKKLRVNVEVTEKDASYEVYKKTKTGENFLFALDENQIAKIQEDLEKIFKRANKIEDFRFSNFDESCNITKIDFFEYAKNLRELGISFANVKDYSTLKNCGELRSIDLWYSDIQNAEVLLELKYVNRLILTGTPLAQNEEEIAKLKQVFPEAKIVVD